MNIDSRLLVVSGGVSVGKSVKGLVNTQETKPRDGGDVVVVMNRFLRRKETEKSDGGCGSGNPAPA